MHIYSYRFKCPIVYAITKQNKSTNKQHHSTYDACVDVFCSRVVANSASCLMVTHSAIDFLMKLWQKHRFKQRFLVVCPLQSLDYMRHGVGLICYSANQQSNNSFSSNSYDQRCLTKRRQPSTEKTIHTEIKQRQWTVSGCWHKGEQYDHLSSLQLNTVDLASVCYQY